MDPFDFWRRVAAANMSLAISAARAFETAAASLNVMRVRGDVIAASLNAPLHADWREMNLMVSEKLTAFGKSNTAATREIEALQARLSASWQQAAMLPLSSVSPAAALDAGGRMATLALDILEATARIAQVAIEPVHRTVAANARRLG